MAINPRVGRSAGAAVLVMLVLAGCAPGTPDEDSWRDDATRAVGVAGNDPKAHLDQINEYAEAGYDELYVANMGPHHQAMIEF